ncbi:MAG: hypothetical protein JO157_18080 [Acetobacteraceae bacterium]|nr:hypothetical protein [Acetobacteraceae bacterium]
MTRLERIAWIAAGIGLLAVVVLWLLEPTRMPYAWLAGFTTFSLWPLGSLALLFAHSLTGGRWGEALRPALLLGASLTPVLILLAIPVVLTLPILYSWARPEGATLANRFWLTIPFYAVRGGLSLAIWTALSFVVRRAPRRTPSYPVTPGLDPGVQAEGRRGATGLTRIAPFALILLAITVTTEAIDSTMSLDPHFTSSAYGMIAAASAGVFALACAILASPPAPPEINGEIGRLLLGLTILWTYLDFMQLLIVWQNDLVTQTPWYLARAHGPAGVAMAAVSLLHSVVPFFALLAPRIRKSRLGLSAVASVLIVAEIIRNFWTVLPSAPSGAWLPAIACIVLMASATKAWTLRRMRHE